MKLPPIAKGIITYIPGIARLSTRETAGTASPRYCYSVWLRYMSLLHASGLPTCFETVAEIGPGASLGVGLAAILCGASRYYGLDVACHANTQRNMDILDALVDLLRRRAPIPGNDEFPEIKPLVASTAFPHAVLTDRRLDEMLAPPRVEAIRAALQGRPQGEIAISYAVPWYDVAMIERETVDLLYSHTVLELVGNLDEACRAMNQWLKPGGIMIHQIDYRSHGISKRWNEHWTYPARVWRIVQGNRPYYYNRRPHSYYLRLFERHGFDILHASTVTRHDGIRAAELASEWKHLAAEDFCTSGAFFQAAKPRSR